MKTRMYCIVNQYISGIHAGIQSAHAIAELIRENIFNGSANERVLLQQWIDEDKTIVVLEGGYQSNLCSILKIVEKVDGIPYAHFCEEQDALNGALTAIAMVLPEELWDAQRQEDGSGDFERFHYNKETSDMYVYSDREMDLLYAVKNLRLKGA